MDDKIKIRVTVECVCRQCDMHGLLCATTLSARFSRSSCLIWTLCLACVSVVWSGRRRTGWVWAVAPWVGAVSSLWDATRGGYT